MTLGWTELLSEINTLFIKITRDKIFKEEKEDFLSHVKKCLKLNKPEDWNYILASEDILEDSNEAISNFLKFGLSGPTKYNELGEKYLRLYGVLNAAYLQQQAIYNLYKFFQCPDIKPIKDRFDKLKILELRHKLGSHSANYFDKSTDDIHVFVPVRIELNDYKCAYFNHLTDEYCSIDIKEAIEEHLKVMASTYVVIVEKSVKTIYKGNENKIQELLSKLEPFKAMLQGDLIVKHGHTDDFSIIKIVSPKQKFQTE